MPDGSCETVRHPGNTPERERGRMRRLSCGSETEKTDDGAVGGGAGILQVLLRLGVQHPLSGYLMTLRRETENEWSK